MITEQQLQEWARLAEQAPPGPWRCDGVRVGDAERRIFASLTPETEKSREHNAAMHLMAASREAVPALVEEVRRLNGRLTGMGHAIGESERDVVRKSHEMRALTEEVERLRNALAAISIDECESTSTATENVHGHARIARRALYGEDK